MSKRAIAVSAAVIAAAAVILAAICIFMLGSRGGDCACIYSDGKKLYSINLGAVTEPYELTVSGKNGTNLIRVESGRICVREADCPDKTCVNTGWISDGLFPIICIPNRLEIRIENATEIDGVAQ